MEAQNGPAHPPLDPPTDRKKKYPISNSMVEIANNQSDTCI